MKRLLAICLAVAFVVGAASAALAAESIYHFKVTDQVTFNEAHGTVVWQQYINPAAADTNNVLTLKSCYPTGTDTTYAPSWTNDFPRNVTIEVCDVTGANNNGIHDVDIVITGTNWLGDTITETLTPGDNTDAQSVGQKAFMTITSVYVPKMDDSGARISVGFGAKLGLPITNVFGGLIRAWAGASEEASVTAALSSTAIESNTWYSTTAVDGTTDFLLRIEVPPITNTTSSGSKW